MRPALAILSFLLVSLLTVSQNVYQTILGDTTGYTNGTFNVTDGGAASYTIPLIITPGTAGTQPSISLVYSSQGGNGLLGLGWSLQGLSAISRSGKTKAQDGETKGVTFSSLDRFALDGERLVKISATGAYGGDGVEYRTEQNAFHKIISHGSISGGGTPAHFIVKTNAGLTMEYGNTSDSRIEVLGDTVLYWLVNKITDTKGNYFSFSYIENSNTGEYVPSRIDYTGNTAAGINPFASIRFEYESRIDTIDKYLNGVNLIGGSKRLKIIKCYFDTTVVRSYHLAYQYSPTNLSQLDSITECGIGGRCHTPTTFTWGNINPFSFQPVPVNNVPISTNPREDIIPMDMNADGVQDIVTIRNVSGTPASIEVCLSNKSGIALGFNDVPFNIPITDEKKEAFGDFNGDSRMDILKYDSISGSNNFYLNNYQAGINQLTFNSVTSPVPTRIFDDEKVVITADFNADGRADILSFNPFNGSNYWLFNTTVTTNNITFEMNGGNVYFEKLIDTTYFHYVSGYRPILNDFDSDGLVDFLFYKESNGNTALLKNIGGSPISFIGVGTNLIAPGQISGNKVSLNTTDINSDGLSDIMYYDSTLGTNRWWLNKGDFTFKPAIAGLTVPDSLIKGGDNLLNLDFNADGYSDLVWMDKATGKNRWFCNNGKTFIPEPPLIDSLSLKSYDLKGIGNFSSKTMFDVFLANPAAGTNKISVLKGTSQYNNLISEFHIGSGQTIKVQYEYMTSDDIYTKRQSAVYPLMDFQATQFSVKSYETDDGIGGMRRMNYKYVGATLHLNGRGFRGFSEVHMTDVTSGIIQSKYYLSGPDSWKYTSSPLRRTETKLPNGIVISITDIENGHDSIYPNSFFSFVKRSSTKNNEIDGTFVDSSVTTYEYDGFGNVTKTITDYGDGYKDSLYNVYDNDFNNWILGRLLRSTLTRYAPNDTSVKSSAFVYDNATGLMTKEITEPDSAATVRIEKTYTYDAMGNITESAVTAWNGSAMQTRKTKTTFDNQGRFVVRTENDLGHVVTKSFDPLLGSELTATDVNGLTVTNFYDGFGRKIRTVMPDGTWNAIDYRKCGNVVTCPVNAYHVLVEQSSTLPPARQYLDLHNKEVRSEKAGFNGTTIITDNYYNDRGLLVKSSAPYYANETPVFTEYFYDISGRGIRTVMPGNRVDSVLYSARTTTYVNTEGQRRTTIKDVKDRLKVSRDHFGNDITYTYDARGNMVKMQDHLGNVISMKYDLYGNKIELNDPDLGTYKYEVNRFGETIKQTDPKNNVVTLEYDTLGRVLKRTEPEGVTTWTYDTQPHGIGLVASVTSYGGYSLIPEYDSLSRKVKETQIIDSATYEQQYAYDSLGRMERITYPSGFAVKHAYSTTGYLSEIKNASTSAVYWRVTAMNARDQMTQTAYGNGLSVNKTYDNTTFFLTGINTKKGSTFLQNLTFSHDNLGNLKQRADLLINKQEDFEYDELNRLLRAKVQGGDSLEMRYDDLGNIIYKSDVGTYHYDGSAPHQVTSIDLTTTQCIPSLLITTDYTSFNKVKEVTKDSFKVNVFYNPERQRNVQKMYKNDTTLVRTKIYVSPLYEKETKNSITTEAHFIKSPEGTIAVYTSSSNGATATKYLHRDHIGSVVMITNDTGAVVQQFSYDAWGKRRNADWSSILTDTTGLAFDRGFTGHEHYDLFDLIDMNGRIYDPLLARFLSPDPFIQDPTNLQSLNRYSYVLNNPLTLVDPSGYFFGWFKKAWNNTVGKVFKMVRGVLMDIGLVKAAVEASQKWVKENWKSIVVAAVAITCAAITVATMGAGSPSFMLLVAITAGAASGFAAGVTATILNGGNVKQALLAGARGAVIGAITSAATFGVGSAASAATSVVAETAIKTIGHGMVQGLASVAQGGKFEQGFINGAISGATQGFTEGGSFEVRFASSTVVGGVTSELNGGKFANGAVTGAFVYLFNESMHEATSKKSNVEEIFDEAKELYTKANEFLKTPEGKIIKGALQVAKGTKDMVGGALTMASGTVNGVGFAIGAVGFGKGAYDFNSGLHSIGEGLIQRNVPELGFRQQGYHFQGSGKIMPDRDH